MDAASKPEKLKVPLAKIRGFFSGATTEVGLHATPAAKACFEGLSGSVEHFALYQTSDAHYSFKGGGPPLFRDGTEGGA